MASHYRIGRVLTMTDPHVCERCGQQGTSCCVLTPGQEQHCFPLSAAERERILSYCGDAGAFALEVNTGAFVLGVKRAFPGDEDAIAALFPVDGHSTHYRLATHADGACVLLGPEGCVLPREVRPYYCQLFPFWVARGRVMIFASQTCLAQQTSTAFGRLSAMLGTTEKEVRRLHGQLRLAWGLDPQDGEPTDSKRHKRFDI